MELNPIQFINMIKNGQNPQQIMMNFLQAQAQNSPMAENLLTLAQNGNGKAIEEIARNLYKERGLDFDKEFNAFKQTFGL